MYNGEVISAIKDYMISNSQTIAVAESVTSGHLQAALSLAAGASKFFHGGITTYNLGQKARHLHVNPIHATACNSVSQMVADEMALHTLLLFGSDWSAGITGYASPMPELGVHSAFAYYSLAFRKEIAHRGKIESRMADVYDVQVDFANQVLTQLSRKLQSN